MSTIEVKLDEELLALVDQEAARSGRPRGAIIADAVRQQLRHGNLRDLLAQSRQRSGLSEEEAMRLAISELDAHRRERSAGDAR